jgi:hypothetical protein
MAAATEIARYHQGDADQATLQSLIDRAWAELRATDTHLETPDLPQANPFQVRAESHIGELATIWHIVWTHAAEGAAGAVATEAGKELGKRLWNLVRRHLAAEAPDALGRPADREA